MQKRICDYGSCAKEATVIGFVLAKTSSGKDEPKTVYACEKHSKRSEFFKVNNA